MRKFPTAQSLKFAVTSNSPFPIAGVPRSGNWRMGLKLSFQRGGATPVIPFFSTTPCFLRRTSVEAFFPIRFSTYRITLRQVAMAKFLTGQHWRGLCNYNGRLNFTLSRP